jgi:trans-2,3-dihydro-3-hydroxyanthranilate isomerase
MKRPCYVVDAFSDRPLLGNSAGVVLDGADLSAAEMQRIAGELRHSETAFPLPAREPQAAFHLRWFSPTAEIFFCGHATLATLHVLAAEAQRIRVPHSGAARFAFTCKPGVLHAELSREGGKLRAVFEAPRASFAPQPVPAEALAAMNLVPEMLDPRIPSQRASGEEGNLYLCLRTRDALARVRPRGVELADVAQQIGLGGFVPFVLAPAPGVDAALRAFFPGHGIDEDPVTGSASAHVALLLHRFEPAPVPRRFVFAQGDEVGRPGRVEIELREESPGELRAWITGAATVTLRGELELR